MQEVSLLNAAQGFPGQLTSLRIALPAGATGASELFPTQGRAVMGVIIPAAWTAAALAFYGAFSNNPASAIPIYNSGGIPEGTAAAVNAGSYVAFPSPDSLFFPFLQLVSVTAGSITPVDQIADRELILILKSFLT